MKTFYILGLIVVSAILMTACGGDNGTPSSPSPQSTTPVTSVFAEGSESCLRDFFLTLSFETSVQGDITAIVDWTFDDSALWMYITDGTCTVEQFQKPECPSDPACECSFLVRSETQGPKPRRLEVSNRSAGDYKLIVWNVGQNDESISYQMLLTTMQTSSATYGEYRSSAVSFQEKQ